MDEEIEVVDIREIALKWRSKHEVYMRLTVDGKIYLPKESYTNNDYIADIMQERKK